MGKMFLVFWVALAHACRIVLGENGQLCDQGLKCKTKIPEYPIMELLHQPYLIDRNQPFLLKGSGSIVWPLSDHFRIEENLEFIFSSYGNVSFETRFSDCSCFGGDLDLCRKEVGGITYFSSAKQKQFGMRSDSLWIQYEARSSFYPCVHSAKQYAPVGQVMERIQKYNGENAVHGQTEDSNQSVNHLSFSFKIIEQNVGNGQLYVGT